MGKAATAVVLREWRGSVWEGRRMGLDHGSKIMGGGGISCESGGTLPGFLGVGVVEAQRASSYFAWLHPAAQTGT